MITRKPDMTLRTWTAALLLSTLLAACDRPAPASEATPPAPAAEAPPPAETAPPDATPAVPVQPAPDAPPPTEPSAAPKPAAAVEPNLDSMSVATPNAKISVAVDLRYQFDGPALPNQPVILHLAAVPRAAGSKVNLSVKPVSGVRFAGGALRQQKNDGGEVYRQEFSITRDNTAPSELRVLVTMETPVGSSFGFFSVPFDSGTSAQKQDSVKQR